MKSLETEKNLLETTHFKKGTIGVKYPGATIINYSLVISSEEGVVSGVVEIVKSTGINNIRLNVQGDIRSVTYGNIDKIINLHGEYTISVVPPAIGSYQQKFIAYLDLNERWEGYGGFTYEGRVVHNVSVRAR